MNKYLKKFGSFLAFVLVVLGWKMFSKHQQTKTYRDQLIEVCNESQDCIQAVEEHFKVCYDTNYDLGGRRKAGGLKLQQFTDCINNRSGVSYFNLEKQEES